WATRMPVAITVVARITEDDGLSPPFEQAITYRDPYYDATKQEVRGLAAASAREAGDVSAAAKIERFVFDTGRDEACLKGKQIRQGGAGGRGTPHTRSG